MSVIDKFLDIMRLNDDDYEFDNDDYDFDEDDYQEEVKEKRPSRKERKAEQQRTETNFEVTEKRPKQQNKITPISKNRKQGQQGMEVCVIKPTSVAVAGAIAILWNLPSLNKVLSIFSG